MHPNKAARKGIVSVLRAVPIFTKVSGVLTAATIVEHPPMNGWISEAALPGIYVFVRSERIEVNSLDSDVRTLLIDIVLQGKGQRDDVIDQVDDLQLAVERTLMAEQALDGLFMDFRPVGSEVYTNQGEVVFAARRVSFEALLFTARLDPAV